MLLSLHIRDFVIVDRMELDFYTGFTVLTGETGAGKSILIDALGLLLGSRADANLIRSGAEKADLTAEFDVSKLHELKAWLHEQELNGDEENTLLVRRTIDSSGRSKTWINGQSVTLGQLKDAGEFLVDIHGQHAHQSLMRQEAQRQLLDAYADQSELVAELKQIFRHWQQKREALDAARKNADAHVREREQLQWQIDELSQLEFSVDEWESLQIEHSRLSHAASLIEGGEASLSLLNEGEPACQSLMNQAQRRLDDLISYDPSLKDIRDLIESANAQISEAVYSLRHYVQRVDLDPERLAQIELRLQEVMRLARKHRIDAIDIPDVLHQWKQRLVQLGDSAGLESMAAEVLELEARYFEQAKRISGARTTAAANLSAAVSQQMQHLAMTGSRFEIAITQESTPASHGIDSIEFQVAPHESANARSIAKVASGGELSRISLALQVVTSQLANVPTLIFDEVDVGIGGRVAEIVGKLLKQLGQNHQVLCITHLPQVAACGDNQLQVAKRKQDNQVLSSITPLDIPARIDEIARMLGGVEITETTRAHASEMLGLA